jgi:ABC-type antimicrobial peptide transport system permease subunit
MSRYPRRSQVRRVVFVLLSVLLASLVLERWSGGEMMGGSPLVYVPGIAAFMLVVGLLAAARAARRGLRVQPTEALRAE